MKLKELNPRPDIKGNIKLDSAYIQFGKLISELTNKTLPKEVVDAINKDTEEINSISDSGKILKNIIRKKQSKIVNLIEKELKLVTKNHYRNTWLALGMAVFGVPLGVAFGASLGNMAFLGIGLPIGMVIGMAMGTGMDKKAFKEGRQLDLELK